MRKLAVIESLDPTDVEDHDVDNFLDLDEGKSCLRGEWKHGKSVSSAFWDPRGRGIVSTSYDDKLRCKCTVNALPYQPLIRCFDSMGYPPQCDEEERAVPLAPTNQGTRAQLPNGSSCST